MKKTSTKKPETSEQRAALDSAVDKVLLGYEVGTVSIATMVTGLERDGDQLTLDLRLPVNSNPEIIQQELGQLLHPHGIKTIHMNVRLPAPMKGSDKSLPKAMPKTTNAMDNQHKPEANADSNTAVEPPITKAAPTQASLTAHPRIRHIIVVASGKGGVGKSTTTVNIALALQKLGNRVGVLDADIYGPSMPTMLGVDNVKPELENEQFVPIDAHGMAMLSIGSLLDGDNTPVAWRGPKATGALMQLYNQTNWPQLDYLVIDMPPGTSDITLTIMQSFPIFELVVVSTPQDMVSMIVKKVVSMAEKMDIRIKGLIENMAYIVCTDCDKKIRVFSNKSSEEHAEYLGLPLLGELPINLELTEAVNEGKAEEYIKDNSLYSLIFEGLY